MAIWPDACYMHWQVEKRAVCAVVSVSSLWAKRDKREQKRRNPGIDHSHSTGRHVGRTGYGAESPRGREWRFADQRRPRGTGFCQHLWKCQRFFHLCYWAAAAD